MTAAHRLVLIGSVAILTSGICLACASVAGAQAIDPANDFLPTYVGPQNGDLDVLSTGAIYDGTNFRFFATLNGAVGTTNGAFYVWGVDRGAGVASFGALAPGVTFDATVIARTSLVTPSDPSLATGTAGGIALGQNAISFTGNTISVIVPGSSLPTRGLLPGQYTINLWPRFGTVGVPNNNNQISDFAPNNSNVQVTTAAPEPGSLPLVAVGGVGLILSLCIINRKR